MFCLIVLLLLIAMYSTLELWGLPVWCYINNKKCKNKNLMLAFSNHSSFHLDFFFSCGAQIKRSKLYIKCYVFEFGFQDEFVGIYLVVLICNL